MALHSIFLDAAGTLITTREPVGAVYARFAAAAGTPVDPATVQRHFVARFRSTPPPQHDGTPSADDDRGWWRTLVGTVLTESGVPAATVDGCFDALYAHYATAAAWQLYPDVEPFLRRCRAEFPHLKLGVLSNFDRRLRRVLAELAVDGYFDSFTISSEIGSSKPHPRIFQAALAAHDCAPENALHIGDSPEADWRCAASAGLRVFELRRPDTSLLDAIPLLT